MQCSIYYHLLLWVEKALGNKYKLTVHDNDWNAHIIYNISCAYLMNADAKYVVLIITRLISSPVCTKNSFLQTCFFFSDCFVELHVSQEDRQNGSGTWEKW